MPTSLTGMQRPGIFVLCLWPDFKRIAWSYEQTNNAGKEKLDKFFANEGYLHRFDLKF